MAEAGILARSEIRVMLSNDYLKKNKDAPGSSADINLITLSPVAAFVGLRNVPGRGLPKSGVNSGFEPRGVSVNAEELAGAPDQSATSGLINGAARNDPYFLVERFACAVMHPNNLTRIRPNGTTARGIIIHG